MLRYCHGKEMGKCKLSPRSHGWGTLERVRTQRKALQLFGSRWQPCRTWHQQAERIHNSAQGLRGYEGSFGPLPRGLPLWLLSPRPLPLGLLSVPGEEGGAGWPQCPCRA